MARAKKNPGAVPVCRGCQHRAPGPVEVTGVATVTLGECAVCRLPGGGRWDTVVMDQDAPRDGGWDAVGWPEPEPEATEPEAGA